MLQIMFSSITGTRFVVREYREIKKKSNSLNVWRT